jgi:hypothetical protein
VGLLPVNSCVVSDVEERVWFIVSYGVLWYVLTCCRAAVAGRELLCKLYPSLLWIFLAGLCISSLCRVEKC